MGRRRMGKAPAAALAAWLRDSGISRDSAAAVLGVSVTSMASYIDGRRRPGRRAAIFIWYLIYKTLSNPEGEGLRERLYLLNRLKNTSIGLGYLELRVLCDALKNRRDKGAAIARAVLPEFLKKIENIISNYEDAFLKQLNVDLNQRHEDETDD